MEVNQSRRSPSLKALETQFWSQMPTVLWVNSSFCSSFWPGK